MEFSIFIDESGIHKDTGHSSFVIVYIYINNQDLINESILRIEDKLRIVNFHWSDFGSKHKWIIRKKFIEASSNLSFSFKYLIIRNPINPMIELHNSMIKMITEDNIRDIFIDGKYPKSYVQSIKNSLRKNGLSIKRLRMVNDTSFPAIRLADALAGLIRSYYDNHSKDAIFLYNLIQTHKKHEPPF